MGLRRFGVGRGLTGGVIGRRRTVAGTAGEGAADGAVDLQGIPGRVIGYNYGEWARGERN